MALRLRRLACVTLSALLFSTQAQGQTGEQGLLWRDGDPFVFCRHGMKHTPRAWIPVPDYTRTPPTPTPGYCPWPTPFCYYQTGWSWDEIFAYYAYLQICPQAERSGRWQGPGDGTRSPYSH